MRARSIFVAFAFGLCGCASQTLPSELADRHARDIAHRCHRIISYRQNLPTELKECDKMMEGAMTQRCEKMVTQHSVAPLTEEECQQTLLEDQSLPPFPAPK